MLIIALRVLFGVAFLYFANMAWNNPIDGSRAGDLRPAFFLAVSVLLGIANGAVWAPFLGEKLSDPLTGPMTRSTYVEAKNHLARLLHWLHDRGHRRLTAWLCFIEGVRHPDSPVPFLLGMSSAREGSWLEKVYAREVFRFENAQNCAEAYQILRRHGLDPRPHRNPEVNLLLVSLERQVKPDLQPLHVPPAPPPPSVVRNRKIKLFEGAGEKENPAPERLTTPEEQSPAQEVKGSNQA